MLQSQSGQRDDVNVMSIGNFEKETHETHEKHEKSRNTKTQYIYCSLHEKCERHLVKKKH